VGVRIPWDKTKNAIAGHAYVGFATAAEAQRALAANGAVMGAGNLHISLAADSGELLKACMNAIKAALSEKRSLCFPSPHTHPALPLPPHTHQPLVKAGPAASKKELDGLVAVGSRI
jgi:hypothetical protein